MPNNQPLNNAMQLRIRILYFASLADRAKKDEEILYLPKDMTLSQLYTTLAEKYSFDLSKNRLGVAVNHEFCDWETPLQTDDSVAFIPPVAGG